MYMIDSRNNALVKVKAILLPDLYASLDLTLMVGQMVSEQKNVSLLRQEYGQ